MCRVVCHSSQHLSAVQEYVVILQFSLHQKYQAVRLDPHRRLLVDHQLKLLEPHFSRFHRCRRLLHPRHLSHSLQPSPTLCKEEFHSSKWRASRNDNREIPNSLSHFEKWSGHNRDWRWLSRHDVSVQKYSGEVCARSWRQMWSGSKFVFPLVVITCPYTTFCPKCCSATLFAATALTFVELTIGNCGANQGGQTWPKHPESIINSCSSVFHFSVRLGRDWSSQFTVYRRFLLSSSENIQSPSSAHPIVFTWEKLGCCADVFELGFQSSTCLLLSLLTEFCHLGFRLSRALAFTLRFVRLLVPTIRCFVSIPSTVSTFSIESWVFCCRFSVTFAWVDFFSFLTTPLSLAGFLFAFPFPLSGDCVDFHWIFVVCVSGWSRLEDASAPQVIFSRHA